MFHFFLPTMALQTKCSEFTGKKVVSQDEIFFWKSGIKKENIAIDMPFNYHEIIIGLFIQCSCNYIGKYIINSTFPMIYQLGEPLVSLWNVAATLDHPSKFNVVRQF